MDNPPRFRCGAGVAPASVPCAAGFTLRLSFVVQASACSAGFALRTIPRCSLLYVVRCTLYVPPMPAKIIDGNALAAATREDVKSRVAQINARGKAVHLAAILVGASPAGELYAHRQADACRAVGIGYELTSLPA